MMQTAFNQTRSQNECYATQNAMAKFFTYDLQDATKIRSVKKRTLFTQIFLQKARKKFSVEDIKAG
jgi:hypothetical protein